MAGVWPSFSWTSYTSCLKALRARLRCSTAAIGAGVGLLLGGLGRSQCRAQAARCNGGRGLQPDSVAATATPSTAAAAAGRRLAHFQARSHTGVGRAENGLLSRNRRRSSASSHAEAIPPARIFVQALEADGLQVARSVTLDLAGRERLLARYLLKVDSGVVPLNGGRPVSIS